MTIGATGVGKSTLMDNLFKRTFEEEKGEQTHGMAGVKIQTKSYVLEEEGVKLLLTLSETVGYGDQVSIVNRKLVVNFTNQLFSLLMFTKKI